MNNILKLALAGAVATVMAVAHAATDTTTFQVKITITESCDIHTTAATDVDFGTNARSSTVAEATGGLNVLCTTGTPYAIGLGNGSNYDTTNSVRRMTDGTNFIAYGLYKSTGTGSPWTTVSTVTGTGNGSNQSVSIYGSVVSGASNVPAGNYADTVTATVTY